MTLPGWAREPLVHFLALGGLVYLGLTWGGTPVDPTSRAIVVDDEARAALALGFERVMGRAPTDAELDARVEQYVREEVLYREALRLGLDEGDAVVRQRMVAKMDMTASAAVEAPQPDDATLRAYLEANAGRYGGDALVSFEQAWFESEAAARAALGGDVKGGAISLPRAMEDAGRREVEARFGERFAAGLASLEPGGEWQGPIASGFGWHLVRLTGRRTVPAGFEALRDRLENDWRSDQIAERKTRAYEVLKSAYRIETGR